MITFAREKIHTSLYGWSIAPWWRHSRRRMEVDGTRGIFWNVVRMQMRRRRRRRGRVVRSRVRLIRTVTVLKWRALDWRIWRHIWWEGTAVISVRTLVRKSCWRGQGVATGVERTLRFVAHLWRVRFAERRNRFTFFVLDRGNRGGLRGRWNLSFFVDILFFRIYTAARGVAWRRRFLRLLTMLSTSIFEPNL